MTPTTTQIAAALQVLQGAGYSIAAPGSERCRMLSAGQVAELLVIGTDRARRIMHELPGSVCLPGGDMRCRVHELEAYLDRHPLSVALTAAA